MPLRCLIVDDHPPFSEAARELLTDQGLAVVATAASSAEAIQRIQELRPDVALVDVDLGNESGFDLARRLAADGSGVRVILISTHDEREFVKLIESSETAGFLAKTELSAETSFRLLQQVEDLKAHRLPVGRRSPRRLDAIGVTKRRAKKGEDGEDTAVVFVGLRPGELPQDAVYVIFDGSLGDPQAPSYTAVGTSLRHQAKHFSLASSEHVQRIVDPLGLHQLLHERWIDD